MRPVSAEIAKISIPFRFTFRHALAARSEGESVLVRITDSEGRVGSGECAPRLYVSGETCQTVRASLQERLPRLLGCELRSFDEARQALEEELSRGLAREEHAAFCAVENALLDLAGRAFGVSAGSVLGPVVAPRIHYSGIVSADGVEEARKACAAMSQLSLRAVKLKVGQSLETDLAILRAAREIFGGDCSLRVDANCAWDAKTALARIESFEPIRLDAVEQPLAADDLDGLAWLTARSRVPIVVDESLVSAEDARTLAERRACHLFNVRISKCGGLLNSARIRAIGLAEGIGSMLGAQVGETALLSAAGRHFATRCEGARFFEGSYGKLLLEEDIAVQDIAVGREGAADALDGPGLGVDVDEAKLAKYVKERERFG